MCIRPKRVGHREMGRGLDGGQEGKEIERGRKGY